MKFLIIRPDKQTAVVENHDDFNQARTCAIGNDGIDFGQVASSIHIAVYEFGLVRPSPNRTYFALFHRLYAGNAVIFKVNEIGDTISIDGASVAAITDHIAWLPTIEDAELAIMAGHVIRPSTAINGIPVETWRYGRLLPS